MLDSMSPVTIVPNADTNAMITPYQDKPEFGYMVVQQSQMEIGLNGFVNTKKRNALIKGEIESLKRIITLNGTRPASTTLPGRICVQEWTESTLPANVKKLIDSNDQNTYEENLENYIKKTRKDGVKLMNGDEYIIRFTYFDPTGNSVDSHVDYTNVEEVNADIAASKAGNTAILPGDTK